MKNTPPLRFDEFNAIWRLVQLKDITEKIIRKNTKLKSTRPLTISAQYGLIDQNIFFNKQIASKDISNYYLIKNGEFAYNKSYSTGYPWGTIKRLDLYEDGVLSTLYILFKATRIYSDFLVAYYETSFWHKEVAKNAAEGARNHGLLNISAADFFDTVLKIPTFEEQVKISNFLKLIDKKIKLQQSLIENIKEYKKGCLQGMFPKNDNKTPNIRFSEFTDTWEQRKLGEVAEIVGGGTPSTSIHEYWGGEIDWYSPFEIGKSIYVSESQKKITELGLQKSSARVLPVGTILFTSRAGIGNAAILAKEGATNQGFQSILPHEFTLNGYFIFSRIGEIKKFAERVGSGSTFLEVSGKQLSKMNLLIPKYEEQSKIGNFFQTLDNTITLHQSKLEKIQELKKGLLQQMFV